MPLPTRSLGRGGPGVTSIGIGLMGLSAFYGKPYPDDERFKFLITFTRAGSVSGILLTFMVIVKICWVVGLEQNPGKRDNIFLASKFGIVSPGAARSDPEYVSSCV